LGIFSSIYSTADSGDSQSNKGSGNRIAKSSENQGRLLELMTENPDISKIPLFDHDTIVIVGGYGSGKSEVSVNLARNLAATESAPVAIADMDIVNPYFRSREAATELEKLGVKSLIPPGAHVHADLPIIIPEIKGAIQKKNGKLILDVGGDDVGARALSSLADAFVPGEYEMFLVLNANRPFTADIEGACKVIEEIEMSSRLKFTGIISNTHLMDDTTDETVTDGLKLARDVSDKTGLRVVFLSAEADILEQMNLQGLGLPVLRLNRSLLKPWETRSGGE